MKRICISDLIERDIGVSAAQLSHMAEHADALYRRRRINGRVIDVPSLELRLVQCWVSDFLRAVDPIVPSCVTAYEKGCSIVANASAHCGHAHILSVDIKNFFHSCGQQLVWRLFASLTVDFGDGKRRRRLSPEECDLMVRLTCYKGALSVGASSSPAIANRIMVPHDESITRRIPFSMSYTRYSDDMTFSSDAWIDVPTVVNLVSDVISVDGFRLNERKTKCAGKKDRRVVTGLVVRSDDRLSIGAKRKSHIKHDLYELLTHGEGDPLAVLGILYFAIQVEPDWAATVLAKYANYGIAREKGVVGALRDMAGNS